MRKVFKLKPNDDIKTYIGYLRQDLISKFTPVRTPDITGTKNRIIIAKEHRSLVANNLTYSTKKSGNFVVDRYSGNHVNIKDNKVSLTINSDVQGEKTYNFETIGDKFIEGSYRKSVFFQRKNEYYMIIETDSIIYAPTASKKYLDVSKNKRLKGAIETFNSKEQKLIRSIHNKSISHKDAVIKNNINKSEFKLNLIKFLDTLNSKFVNCRSSVPEEFKNLSLKNFSKPIENIRISSESQAGVLVLLGMEEKDNKIIDRLIYEFGSASFEDRMRMRKILSRELF